MTITRADIDAYCKDWRITKGQLLEGLVQGAYDMEGLRLVLHGYAERYNKAMQEAHA